ncbi:MAG: DUF3618 domain-containing protein [Oceanicaulis sp.]
MSTDTDQIETDARQHRQALREDLDAIFDRLSPGQIMDEALGQFGGAKSLTQNLGAQVRDNPLPVLVTAAGLAWLVSSSRGGSASGGGTSLEMHAGPADDGGALGHVAIDPDDYDADFNARRVEIAEAGCVKLESESDEDYENRLARTRADALELGRAEGETDLGFRERVSDTAKKTREKASSARKRINDGAAKARKGLAGAAGSAKHGVQSAAGSAKHGAQSAAGSVKHGAQKASGATADAARSGANSASALHDGSPLATGAIALAAGALIGALLPLTRTEAETFKRPADEAGKAAAGAASKAADQAREARDKVQEKHAEETGGKASRSSGDGAGEASNGDGRAAPPGERAAPPPPPSTH